MEGWGRVSGRGRSTQQIKDSGQEVFSRNGGCRMLGTRGFEDNWRQGKGRVKEGSGRRGVFQGVW